MESVPFCHVLNLTRRSAVAWGMEYYAGNGPVDQERATFEQVEQSRHGRFVFAGVLLALCVLVGGLVMTAMNGTGDNAAPVLPDDVDDVVDDNAIEDQTENDDDVSEDESVVVERLDGLASPVAATLELVSYEVTLVQEVESFDAELSAVVVGTTSRSTSRLSVVTAETLAIDGLVYEMDGSTWHLKPLPTALTEQSTLAEAVAVFADLPAREIDRVGGIIRLEILCDEIDLGVAELAVRQACPQSGTTIASVSEATGLLVAMRIDGVIEISPGQFEEGFIEILIESAEELPPFEAPTEVDVSRAACIADAMGVPLEDAAALSEALSGNTTDRNGEVYGSCGFPLFPPGWDFLD